MSYIKQSLLDPETEQQFKEDFFELWNNTDLKGSKIAEKLQLGVEGTRYAKVKPEYIYYYRQKFEQQHLDDPKENPLSFPVRQEPKFKKNGQRYNVHPDVLGLLSQDDFIKQLNDKLPYPDEGLYWKDVQTVLRARAYNILHFYLPLRSSEIRERSIVDFEVNGEFLIIHLLRKKKGHKIGDKEEPIEIPITWKLMDEVLDWIKPSTTDERDKSIFYKWVTKSKQGKTVYGKPFGFSRTTAQNYIHKVFPKRFPHNFRFMWITDKLNKFPRVKLEHIKAKTYLTTTAIERYTLTERRKARELDTILSEDYE